MGWNHSNQTICSDMLIIMCQIQAVNTVNSFLCSCSPNWLLMHGMLVWKVTFVDDLPSSFTTLTQCLRVPQAETKTGIEVLLVVEVPVSVCIT